MRRCEAALRWQPEELYLYPLYVRPLTGLDRRGAVAHDDLRLALLPGSAATCCLAEGYEQVSMRMFRRAGVGDADDPVYCCQDDGMVGLGCGARSYTRRLHYSTDFAVGRPGVREIIADYVELAPDAAHAVADHGVVVTAAEGGGGGSSSRCSAPRGSAGGLPLGVRCRRDRLTSRS